MPDEQPEHVFPFPRTRRIVRLLAFQALPALLIAALAGCGGADPDATAAPASGVPASQPVTASGSDPASAVAAPSSPAGVAAPTTAATHPTTGAPPKPPGNGGGGGTPGKEQTPANDAAKLKSLPANTTQVVIVQSAGVSATTATLQAYAKSAGAWQPALGPMAARLGSKGFSDAKREGDRTTPAGMFAIDGTMYGIAADPGVRYRYHQVGPDDWWNENSDSPGYNTFSHGPNPGGPSEALWEISPQYTHFAVIRYNMPATPGRGSGIFLHQSNGNSTLGCVSLAQSDLTAVLRWLDPSANPRIVMAPTAWLGRY
ncbi:L,D-transpeptidase family protein [Dactylosporangium sp. CS-047395]|uniref:L,D-transpeptidase family protein n=1 Tax=Dactylosporangium sp. CS-047395 TaxID=3239936 RepID=UPI003D8DEA57